MKRVPLLCTISLLGGTPLAAAAPLHAQAEDWLAWYGCWQADGAPAGEYLCIVPDGAAGVRMVSVVDGAAVTESRVVTDGRPRRVETDGCTGSEVAFWSADYHRVFLRSELSCEAGVERRASGVFAITSEGSWVSVQAVTIDGRTATRTVNYTAADDAAAPATLRSALQRAVEERTVARRLALAPIDARAVDEAVERIDAAAVQEWLSATGQPFQLADELAPAATGEPARSALDHTGYFTQDREQPARDVVHVIERPAEVHVIERPVYITHDYVHDYRYRYRTCWDPFFSGLVLGVGHGVGIGLGHTHCGRSYFTHYSPWGYDLYGWRFVHVRPVVRAGRPVIRYRDREPRRSPRMIYRTPRDADRRVADTRGPVRTRQDAPLRIAKPRDDTRASRGADPRAFSQQPRSATPRSHATPSRSYATPSRSYTTPSRSNTTPSRSYTMPSRSAAPRGEAASWRTHTAPPPPRSSMTQRIARPRTSSSASTRAPARMTAPSSMSRPSRQPSVTPMSSARSSPSDRPARTARPRGSNRR